MSGWKGQVGVKKEAGYGTFLAVDHFFEFDGEMPLMPRVERLEHRGIRTVVQGPRTDRVVPYVQGHEGQLTMPALTKNFAVWLELALGGLATTGPVDSVYTHTGTVGATSINGKSYTLQAGIPRNDATPTVDVFTYTGCKVTMLGLQMDQTALLNLTVGVDAKTYVTAGAGTVLASASFPSGTVEPFSFVGGTITIGSATVELNSFGLEIANNIPQRPKIGNVHPEPLVAEWPDVTWTIGMEHDAVDHYNRVIAATYGAAHGSIVATFRSASLAGTATYPEIQITIPSARFDAGAPKLTGPGLVTAEYSGKASYDGTNSMVTIAVKSTEATP